MSRRSVPLTVGAFPESSSKKHMLTFLYFSHTHSLKYKKLNLQKKKNNIISTTQRKKMESKSVNEIVFVGDRSGSMNSMGNAPWKGMQEWANDQAAEAIRKGDDTRVTIVAFDDQVKRCVDSVAVDEWENISDDDAKAWMNPRGTTRLFDTAIEELQSLGQRMKTRGPSCKGVFALFTDGLDNQSKHSVKEMNVALRQAREASIECYFLAANQDAITSGVKYGFSADRCLTTGSDQNSATQGFRALSATVQRGGTYTELERQQSAPHPPRGQWSAPAPDRGQSAPLPLPHLSPPALERQDSATPLSPPPRYTSG